MSRNACAALTLLVGALALSACGSDGGDASGKINSNAGTDAPLAAPDQSVVVATPTEPQSMDPHLSADPGALVLFDEVYETLTRAESNKIVPKLAAEMPKEVDSKTWEVQLRDDVKFSDGKPFTADAVVYTLTRVSDPKYPGKLSETQNIAGASKVDDHTVRIKLKSPDPLLPNKLVAIKIMRKGQAEALTKPVGTGPYKVESYRPGGDAVLAYNENFRGPRPQVTKLTIKFIPDEGTRRSALAAGEVDLMTRLDPARIDAVPQAIMSEVDTWNYHVRINTHQKPLDDVRVRKALNYAIPREKIAEELFPKGMVTPTPCQPASDDWADASTKLTPYTYDIDKAKQLVKEAGAEGAEVTLEWTADYAPLDREVGQVVAQELNKTGLKVKLHLMNYNAFIKAIYKTGKGAPDLTASGIANSLATASRLAGYYYLTDGVNSTVADPKLNELVERATAESVGPTRQEYWDEAWARGCDEAVMGFMYSYKDLYGAQEKISYRPLAADSRPGFSAIRVVKPTS